MGVTGISIEGYACAEFSGIGHPTTVKASSFTLTDPAGTVVTGPATLRGIHTAVFYLNIELATNTQYAGKLARAIPTLDTGVALQQDVTWSFTTAAMRTATLQAVTASSMI